MKNIHSVRLLAVIIGLAAARPIAAHPTDGVHSPRGRALAEDRRTIKEVTPERLDRRAVVGSPRAGAHATLVAPGTTPDRLERGSILGSPRGREAFGFGGSSR